jgi:hypothetical protein
MIRSKVRLSSANNNCISRFKGLEIIASSDDNFCKETDSIIVNVQESEGFILKCGIVYLQILLQFSEIWIILKVFPNQVEKLGSLLAPLPGKRPGFAVYLRNLTVLIVDFSLLS